MAAEPKEVPPRKLKMRFAGRFIDLLGNQMYGGPVPAVAEMVANAWDADAREVAIAVPDDPTTPGAEISVKDKGIGMSFDEINEYYLHIGYERRKRGEKTPGGRLVMGRKGIGKLAGFGISEEMSVISVKAGHLVEVLLDYHTLKNCESIDGLELTPLRDEPTQDEDGVTVIFRRLKLERRISVASFTKSMARRFAIQSDQMAISINGTPLTKEALTLEFREPPDAPGVANEDVPGVGKVSYWYGFMEDPIVDPELRGFTVFARGRLAQATPFFFNLSGGITGQVGLEYLTGQVTCDSLDATLDCVATDRQGVNWQFDVARELESWGQKLVKSACKDWKNRRSKKKIDIFRHNYSVLNERIHRLPEQEQKDVISALDRIADLESVSTEDFQMIAESMLSGVERESVRKVIRRINTASEEALSELVAAIQEWDVISAVFTAEVALGRIEIIDQLARHIRERLPEKTKKGQLDIQDFLKSHPWLLGHEYEHLRAADFHHEKGVDKWIGDVLLDVDKTNYAAEDKSREGRRFDLLCIRDESRIVILELMQPGKPADYDHLMRLNRYVTRIESALSGFGTALDFRGKAVHGMLIADNIERDGSLSKTLERLGESIDAVSWQGLLNNVKNRYREFFELQKAKAPDDPRLKGLVQNPDATISDEEE